MTAEPVPDLVTQAIGRDVYVARQPICTAALKVLGYELLFRDGSGNRAVIANPEAATSTVVLNACSEIGLDSLVGNGKAYINVSHKFLIENEDLPLPPDRVVLELLEDSPVSDEIIDVLRHRWSPHYEIALDDFYLTEENARLLEFATVVKLDVLALSRDDFKAHARELGERGITALAEKVEDYDTFEWTREAGCSLFQGHFFCEPRTIVGRTVEGGVEKTRLLSALQDQSVGFEELEKLIESDIGLSFRLLRFVNSAHFGMRRTIDSVHDAFVLLGVENVRRWATLVVLSGMPDHPQQLVTTAMHRARTCELLARGGSAERRTMFTVGLFSLIDALLGVDMETALQRLPFSPQMKAALLRYEGPAGRALRSVIAYERGNPQNVDAAVGTPAQVEAAYLEAMKWADGVAEQLQ